MGNDPPNLTQKLAAGAIAGFVTAAGVDFHAWQSDGYAFSWAKSFDLKKAVPRWIGGAITGALIVLKAS